MTKHIDELYGNITKAVGWNAFSYTIFKVTSTALTFVLFDKLTTSEFALWTGINSLIYVLLVWTDLGMRKTIPAFFPSLAYKNRTYFIFTLIALYVALLNVTCPIALWVVNNYAYKVGLPIDSGLLVASGMLFFGHGLEMLFQSIFHAFLWHKMYNTLLAVIQIIYMFAVIGTVIFLPFTPDIVYYIVMGKGIAGLLCVALSGIILIKRLPTTKAGQDSVSKDFIHRFLTHAGLMWIGAVLKSLTERNITVPFITYCLGPVLGNIYKVAQDAAMLFQRLIFRTIGTTDTVLFAHLKSSNNESGNMQFFQVAFTKLATMLAYLTVPLIGVVWFLHCHVDHLGAQEYGFYIFIIVAIGLLLELLLTPYERMLEVLGNYKDLSYAYVLYITGCGLLFLLMGLGYLNLIPFVIGLFVVRLSSMTIMGYAVYRRYHIVYPYKKTLILLVCMLVLGYVAHLLAVRFCGDSLVKVFNYVIPLNHTSKAP